MIELAIAGVVLWWAFSGSEKPAAKPAPKAAESGGGGALLWIVVGGLALAMCGGSGDKSTTPARERTRPAVEERDDSRDDRRGCMGVVPGTSAFFAHDCDDGWPNWEREK